MILTGDGTEMPIENIKEGMEVYAFDKESGELKVSKVSQTFFHPKENTYLIVNDNLLVTPNHPVLNNNKWVEIGELEEGDMLTDKDNNPIPISKIEEVNELSDVFNFEVEKYHTYVAEGIIVHNKNPGYGGEGDDDTGGGFGLGGDYFWPSTGP
jgi:intein/homing endonuclease